MARRTLLALAVLLCSAAVRQPAAAAEAASPAAAQLGDGRSCYGCIGWCTYGDQCRPPNHTKWYDVAKDIGVQGCVLRHCNSMPSLPAPPQRRSAAG